MYVQRSSPGGGVELQANGRRKILALLYFIERDDK
nr:MAG TPA: hypothetical protein [Caudoviricetes sp.]